MQIYEEPVTGLVAVNNSPSILKETTLFTATVNSGSNLVFDWDLGDGTFASGARVSHVFANMGIYTATLTATNAVSEAQAQTKVTVFEEPIAGLAGVNNSPTLLGETTLFTATVLSGSNVEYIWDLGDGSIVTGSVVSHVYLDAGIYTAAVIARNALGEVMSTTIVDIFSVPTTRFFWLPMLWRDGG